MLQILCTKCFSVKPTTEFYKHKKAKRGFRGECKTCCSALNKVFRDANPTYANQQYLKNRDYILAKQKIYVAANAAAVALTEQKYARANREKIAAYSSAWTKANAEKNRLKAHHRRLQSKSNGEFAITTVEMKRLYSAACIYCGSRDRIEADHVMPLSRGGRQSIGNLAPACLSCNRSKGSKFVMEWRMSARLDKA